MMQEWLTRDPLNGISITIAFFSSLIIGRYLREHRGKTMDPRIRIIASILLIVTATSMKHWYFPLVISVSCTAVAIKLRILRDYGKKLIFPLVLAFFIFAVQGLTYGANEIGPGVISVYEEGLEYGFLIFSRVLASVSVMILLIITTSENELLESMRWFRVPGTIIEISAFMTRYIRTFQYDAIQLKLAQESRCGFSGELPFKNRMQNTASICGLLITRAFSRSEEVHKAMISRAWKPQAYCSADIKPLNKSDMVLALMFSSGIIALLVFDRFL